MTDQKDYTREPEVLKACGWKQVHHFRLNEFNWYRESAGNLPRGYPVPVTLSELWEGLCRVWSQRQIDPLDADARDLLENRLPGLSGMSHVVLWEPGETHFFTAKEYGSLPNAVAAALHWVLQQKKEG